MSAVTVRVHSDRDGDRWTPMTWTADELPRILDLMGIGSHTPPELFAEAIPFALNDTTAGAENKLQAVVIGGRERSLYFCRRPRRSATPAVWKGSG